MKPLTEPEQKPVPHSSTFLSSCSSALLWPALAAVLALAPLGEARASNPLEYPDNGSAAFSRGGAWLAVGSEPIATHYNPAALATQVSALSLEQQLNFVHTCFDRRGPGNVVVGPNDTGAPIYEYRRVCNARGSFPNTIPSVALSWRATGRLGLGIAVVPPAAYGTSKGQFPPLAEGFDTQAREEVLLPAPYRYLQLEQRSTILFPTLGVGYELARGFRVGVGFIAGLGLIQTSAAAVSNLGTDDALGDHMLDDSLSTLRAQDLFVPGVIASLHGSPLPVLDLAVWARWVDAIRASTGTLDVTQRAFNANGGLNPPCAGTPSPDGTNYTACTSNQSVPNHFDDAIVHFEYPIPPEIRWGVRFHQPRARVKRPQGAQRVVRDPLADDVFDVEIDQSITLNSTADTIEVRFKQNEGRGALITEPTNVPVPPNVDRATGYKDSVGVRVGGQWNAVQNVFGIRAGAWLETRAQDPRFLTMAPVGATRCGFGGGVVVRSSVMDVSIGYQRHLSLGLDNRGYGAFRAPAATGGSPAFDLDLEPPGVAAADRTQFRTVHSVNGGKVTFSAHAFTLGGTVRF